MVTNSNPSTLDMGWDQPEPGQRAGPSTVDAVIGNLHRRRDNALHGGVNCIPLPFERFRSEVPGIEQGQYILFTAAPKTGKTNLASFICLYNVLDFAYMHPGMCSVHVDYYALEESVQKVIERYMAHLLWKLDGIRISPTDLRSTSQDFPVGKDVLDLLASDRYRKRLDFMESCVSFHTEATPASILETCERYARSAGKCATHRDVDSSFKEVEVVDSYEPDDPNHYKLVIVDHIGLVGKDRELRAKDVIDKVSEYFVRLRNIYGYTCVAIQQQAAETEGLEARKMKQMVPSLASLGDSKYTSRDVDLALGLFAPDRFGLDTWAEYNIADKGGGGLRSYARFMYVLANRNGEMGGVCPLFFDGAVCDFEELPRPNEVDRLARYYNEARDRKSYRQRRKLMSLHVFLARTRRSIEQIWKKKTT